MEIKQIKVFDELYSDFCEQLRKDGKSVSLCAAVKSAASDLSRVQILLRENPNIVTSFYTNIREFYEEKDEKQAKQYILSSQVYEENQHNFTIQALSNALVLVPHVTNLEEKYFLQYESVFKTENFNWLISKCSPVVESNSVVSGSQPEENHLLASIFIERSSHFYKNEEYHNCLQDSFHAVYYGCKKTYDFILRIGVSYKILSYFELAKLALKYSVKLLRESSVDNETKSLEAVKIVKLMKEVQESCDGRVNISEDDFSNRRISEMKENCVNNTENMPSLYDSPNNTLIGASSVLQLKFSPDKGRHVLAIKTIPPGSTLIVEDPYVFSLHPEEYRKFCFHCCKEIKSFIPCGKCSAVIFCSQSCRSLANGYHKFECNILKLLDSSQTLGDMAVLCFRTISCTDLKAILNQSVTDIETQTNQNENKELGLDSEGKLNPTNYSSVFAQTTNSDKRLSGDLLKRAYAAIYMTLCLQFTGYFSQPPDKTLEDQKDQSNLSKEQLVVASVILRHLQSASCNAYGVNSVTGTDPRKLRINEIGGATYPIISTTNHSCNPNVYRYTLGKICIVKSLRQISPGEEILDSYGPVFASMPKHERMKYLELQYLFTCECLACAEDWPAYSDLPKQPGGFLCPKCGAPDAKEKRKCRNCGHSVDFKKVLKAVKNSEKMYLAAKETLLNSKQGINSEVEKSICHHIEMLQKIHGWPCKAVIECQEGLKLCWNRK